MSARKQMRIISAKFLRDMAAFLLATGLLLAVVETSARFVVGAMQARDALRLVEGEDAVSQTLAWLDLNLAPLDKDIDLLWRNRPSVEKRQLVNPQPLGGHEEWTIVNDARGFRGVDPVPTEKPANEFRVLCIGDSVTFGFNVDQADSYPERLQAALRARYPGRAVRVINAGTPGWSWLQGVHFLEREGLALRPDVVIMAHGANDRYFPARITDEERIGELRRPATRRLESVRLLLERTGSYRLVQRWFAPRGSRTADLTPGCQRQVAETGSCGRVGLGQIEAAVGTAIRLARSIGADLLVLNVDFEETDAVTAVRNAVRQERVPFANLVFEHRLARAGDENARAQRLGLAATQMREPTILQPAEATRVLFRVLVPQGGSSVRVDGSAALGRTVFSVDLHDDGADGDEIAADRVWSGRHEFGSVGGPLIYSFFRDGVPELVALPPLPSTQGGRKRRVTGETILPVEVFGDLYQMAERMHPNAEGQEFITQRVLKSLPALQAFARWSASDHARSVERN